MSGAQLKASVSGEDVVIENGSLVVVKGDESLRQTLQRIMLTVKGAYRYDLSQGVPYFQRILGKAPNLNAVSIIIRRVLLQHPQVKDVRDVDFSLNKNRELSAVKISVVGERGPIVLNVPIRIETARNQG